MYASHQAVMFGTILAKNGNDAVELVGGNCRTCILQTMSLCPWYTDHGLNDL